MDILWAVKRSLKVKIRDVKAGKIGSRARQDTDEHDIEEFKQGSVCTEVTRVAYVVAANGDPWAFWIIFFGEDKTDHLNVVDFFAAVNGGILIIDEMKNDGALDSLAGTAGSLIDSLTDTHKLVGIRCILNIGYFRMNEQLAVIKELACVVVKHRHFPIGSKSYR